MRLIARVDEAMNYVVNTYGGHIVQPYKEEINTNYLGQTVGYIYAKNDVHFFLRFRRNVMNFNNHYPQFEQGGIGFGFNRSEIESQIHGMLMNNGDIIKKIWCMVVRPDNKVYVANPAEVKEFVRRFNTVKSYFRKPDVPDEDEDIFNVPFRLFFSFDKWLSGEQTQSDYDWQAIRCLTKDDYKNSMERFLCKDSKTSGTAQRK